MSSLGAKCMKAVATATPAGCLKVAYSTPGLVPLRWAFHKLGGNHVGRVTAEGSLFFCKQVGWVILRPSFVHPSFILRRGGAMVYGT